MEILRNENLRDATLNVRIVSTDTEQRQLICWFGERKGEGGRHRAPRMGAFGQKTGVIEGGSQTDLAISGTKRYSALKICTFERSWQS